MALTVADISDDIYFEFKKLGIEEGVRSYKSQAIRLIKLAENEFAEDSWVLYTEGTTDTTADIYDYSVITKMAGTTRVVQIHNVEYNGKSLDRTSMKGLGKLPTYWTRQIFYAMKTRNDIIRLGFNPATGIDYLKVLYSYSPQTTIANDSSSLSVPEEYRKTIAYLTLSKYFETINPDLAEKFFVRYRIDTDRLRSRVIRELGLEVELLSSRKKR